MAVTEPGSMRVRLDSTWRRPDGGNTVIAGSPLRLFRLSEGGAHVIGLAEQGAVPATGAIRQLLDRFVDAGAVHPVPERGRLTLTDVTVVVPAFDRLPASLDTLADSGVRTIIVDDASPRPLELPVGTPSSVVIVRRDDNGGPAAARNTGLAEVATPLVLFLDADVLLPCDGVTFPAWLAPLLDHFGDERVALVAPRIVSAPGAGVIADYEQHRSPLDLGDEPARIAAGTRVSYVPAAALLCRSVTVHALDGFDASLRFGEDVDLEWRLADAGHRCRYEPEVVAQHEPRRDLAAMLRQRVGYGRSAASLARRHPGALAPARMSGWSLAAWLLLAARRPVLAIGLVVGTVAALQRKLTDVPATESRRLALLGTLGAGRQLCDALRRVWWPIALVIAICSRRARLPLLAAITAPAVAASATRRSLRPLVELPLALADDAAYGAGVWLGVWAERDPGPLLPEIRNWPTRAGG